MIITTMRAIVSIAIAVFIAPTLLLAQSPSPSARPTGPVPNPLAAFTPFIGRDWVGDLPGAPVTDTQHFEWTLDRQFVRNIHKVRTADGQVVYEGETIYAWNVRASYIAWWYWNSSGGYITGTVRVNPDGSLLAEGENHGPVDQLDRTRSVMRMGDNQWTMSPSQQQNGQWTDQPVRVYRAVK